MRPVDGPPGWFGKLASLGDFASRRMPAPCLRTVDAWLAASMAESRRHHGDDWPAPYLDAPLWHCAWSPGVLDTQWWFGVLMPSCDSAGRYFPLLVLQPRPHAPDDAAAMRHLGAWQAAVAEAALATLDGGGIDALEAALGELPCWPAAAPTAVPPAPGLPWQAAIARCAAWPSVPARSLWWGPSDGGDDRSVLVLPGLPSPGLFAAALLRRAG